MRITCTNCDAQYEVEDSAIPATGRDVQCSNCGHSWFQAHPAAEAEAEDERALFGAEHELQEAAPPPAAAAEGPAAGDAVAVSEARTAAETDADDDGEAGDDAAEAPAVRPEREAARPRRAIDESVLAVLREEAEREAEARRAEATRGIEVQTDLGLVGAARMPVQAPTPVEEKPEDEAVAGKPAQRRDLLPDIEVINSTLRSGSEARDGSGTEDAPIPVVRTSGFRSGFAFMLVVGVVLMAVYTLAPRIADVIPATEPTLAAYVRSIDAARLWLDGAIQQAAEAIRGLSG